MASNSMLGRVPPQNEEAERAVLGAILLNEKVLVEVTDFLSKDDFFYKVAHQQLFAAILSFRQESTEALDLITLSSYLKRKNQVDQCGGLSYISTLTSDVPTTTNAAYYAKILKALSQRRKLLLFASKLKDNAFDESQEIQQVIDEGEQILSKLNNETAGSDAYQSIKDLITQTISDIEYRSTHGTKNGLDSGYTSWTQSPAGSKKTRTCYRRCTTFHRKKNSICALHDTEHDYQVEIPRRFLLLGNECSKFDGTFTYRTQSCRFFSHS